MDNRPRYSDEELQEFREIIEKKIALAQRDYDDMMEELLDRFGEPPKTVQTLLAVANLKALAHRIYLTEVKQLGDEVRLTMYENAQVDTTKIPEILSKYPEEMQFKIEAQPYFIYKPRKRRAKDVIPQLAEGKVILHAGPPIRFDQMADPEALIRRCVKALRRSFWDG